MKRGWLTNCLVAIGFMGVFAPRAMAWEEPARGSQTRQDLMDALRPLVEWKLGGPLEFVVYDLRQSGDRAFVMVAPQRRDGQPIDLAATPMVRDFGEDAAEFSERGLDVVAFYQREGRQWAVVDWSLGATDVWWFWGPYCRAFKDVLEADCPEQ